MGTLREEAAEAAMETGVAQKYVDSSQV